MTGWANSQKCTPSLPDQLILCIKGTLRYAESQTDRQTDRQRKHGAELQIKHTLNVASRRNEITFPIFQENFERQGVTLVHITMDLATSETRFTSWRYFVTYLQKVVSKVRFMPSSYQSVLLLESSNSQNTEEI